jgi:Relaxase/Mobilisation nuclease domain
MIIKGGSRAKPADLAAHLQRTDTNERVLVLEVAWGSQDLRQAFSDWQDLVAMTKQGELGLYHVNIDPHQDYTMSGEQWAYAIQKLEAELGLEGQPRAVVMHVKHGREHVHVVWGRTDLDTQTLRSDSNNYEAHERSARHLEQTFGHEIVPGPHTGRDKSLARNGFTHAEWQQAERTGVSVAERRGAMRDAWEQSDTGTAFREALAAQGYMLATGDRRGFVAIDREGELVALGKRSLGVSTTEISERLAGVELPDVATARAAQRQAREAEEAERRAREPPRYGPDADDRDIAAIEDRQKEARERLAADQAAEARRLEQELANRAEEARHQVEAEIARREAQKPPEPEPPLLQKIWRSLKEIIIPGAREAREAEEARQQLAARAALELEKAALLAEQGRITAAQLAEIERKQAAERDALERRLEDERALRLDQAARARDIARQIEEARAQVEELQRRQGLGQDPPDQSRAR